MYGKCFLRAQRSCLPEVAKVVPYAGRWSINVSQQVVLVLKVLMDVRLGTVRGQERTSLKVQCHWQLNAQDCKGQAKRCGTSR